MNNPYKVLPVYRHRKINANNQLHKFMKYQAIIADRPMYFKMRSWCLRTFGESIEYNSFIHYRKHLGIDPPWSWNTACDQRWKGQIYLRDDNELAMFDSKFKELATQQMNDSP